MDSLNGILRSGLLLILPVFFLSSTTYAQTNASVTQTRAALSILDTTKEQDGLVGSVRRVKTEYAKIVVKEGKSVEGPRQLMEVTTYGVRGNRVENVSYPINDPLVGKEEYRYDSKGNIVEMILRDERGNILSREAYDYEFDSVGNWIKMVTSLVVVENGEIKREPVEVTYRTLTYYYAAPTDVALQKPGDSGATIESAPKADGQPPKSDATPNGEVISAAANHSNGTAAPTTENSSPTTNASTPPPTKAENTDASRPEVVAPSQPAPQSEKTTETSKLDTTESTAPPASYPESISNVEKEKKTPSEQARVVAEPIAAGPNANVAVPASESSTSPTSTDTGTRHPNIFKKPDDVASPTDTPSTAASPISSPKPESTTPNAAENQAMELYIIGVQQLESGDADTSLRTFVRALALFPTSAEIQMGVGNAFLNLKKDKEALRAFNESLRLNPQLAEAQYGAGFANYRMNRHRDAVDAFKKAIALHPDMAKAHFGLALAYQQLGKSDLVVQEQRILERLDRTLAARLAQAFSGGSLPCQAARNCR